MDRLILAALALGWCAACRADSIDAGLLAHGDKIVRGCVGAGHKAVGVVRFRVRVPGVAASIIEPLSSNLACRVENLLILADQRGQLKVIRGIGAQASALSDKIHNIGGLFGRKYGLAWGRERVKPDAILDGSVTFAAGLKMAEVAVECQDGSGNRKKLVSFEVGVDRNVLADAGLPFTVNGKGWESCKAAELDARARAEAEKARKSNSGTTSPARLVKLEVFRDDERLAITRGKHGQMNVPVRPTGGKWAFQLTNTSKEEVGVVLRVGGCGAIEKDGEQVSGCRRLLLGPGKSVKLTGHLFRDAEGKHDFRVLKLSSAERSPTGYAPQLEGLFEVGVFLAGKEDDGLEKKSLRGFGITEGPREGLTREKLQTQLKIRCGLPLAKEVIRLSSRPDVRAGEKIRPDGPTMARPRFVEFQRFRAVGRF